MCSEIDYNNVLYTCDILINGLCVKGDLQDADKLFLQSRSTFKRKSLHKMLNSWTFDGTPMIASTIRTTRWILVNILCDLSFIFTICTNQYYRFHYFMTRSQRNCMDVEISSKKTNIYTFYSLDLLKWIFFIRHVIRYMLGWCIR